MAFSILEINKNLKTLSRTRIHFWNADENYKQRKYTALCANIFQDKQYLMDIFYHTGKIKNAELKFLRVWKK